MIQQFPSLNESSFVNVRKQVHSAAKVIGKFREVLVKPIAKNDNLWLTIVDAGFCTPPMNDLKELEIGCDLEKGAVEIANAENKYEALSMNGKSAANLCNDIAGILKDKFGINTDTDPSRFSDTEIQLTAAEAKDFQRQFVNYAALLRNFHKTINQGVKTEICLWPHHFDFAFKWFSGRTIGDEQEQMGIGFSSGDENYELPYLYMTLWPELRKTNTLEIPEGAVLHDMEWTGFILPYEAVIEKKSQEQQEELINNYFDVSFKAILRGFSKR